MSHRIEFNYAAWRIPANEANTGEDQFLVASLGGDNNCITSTGAVARRWSAMCLGDRKEVVRQACHLAKSCEGGSVQMPGRRWITPEGYIAKVRKLIETAPHISDGYKGGFFRKHFKITAPKEKVAALRETNPEVIARLEALSEPAERKDWYSNVQQLEWEFALDQRQMAVFFGALPFFFKSRCAWDVCSIRGPGEK